MRIPRIYQNTDLRSQDHLLLNERASHYLRVVLRAKCNDPLILFNGKGGEFVGKIDNINKREIKVFLEKFEAREVESPISICVAQGIVRNEKMDWIAQKTTELGVTSLVPLITTYSQIHFDKKREKKRYQHLEQIIISASEQCGRNRLVKLNPIEHYNDWLVNAEGEKIILIPSNELITYSLSPSSSSSFTLLIGPEGGLSPEEISMALKSGFKPLSLGPRILRAETATIAAVSLIQYLYGNINSY